MGVGHTPPTEPEQRRLGPVEERGTLRPRARLLRTLGSDLISSDKVALIELVKNSYDADASTVVIRFRGPLNQGEGRIEVWDDGHGMDVETLRSSWLDIATDVKKKQPVSKGGRRVLGEKGIGRLAAARLGAEMLLVTRMADAPEVKLLIDWMEFDREGAYLDEVEVAWEVGQPTVFANDGAAADTYPKARAEVLHRGRGTLVEVDNLTHAWQHDDFIDLRTALTRLIRPRPLLSGGTGAVARTIVEDFAVFLAFDDDVPDSIRELAGAIEPSSDLRRPHYRLTGSVSADGSARLHYEQLDPPLIVDLGQKQLWSEVGSRPQAGPFDFELNAWDRDKPALQRTLRPEGTGAPEPGTKQFQAFRETLDEVAGVSVYRDGFRVLPFGEKGDDWLGLDLRRVQSPTRRLSNNQIIGHVFIGADANQMLRDQTNREGFLEGPAYSDLRVMVRAALNELEVRRYVSRRPLKAGTETSVGLFRQFDLGEIRSMVAASHPRDSRLIGLLAEKDREIQRGVTEVQHVLSRYSRLATLGSLIDQVLHDGRSYVAALKNFARFGLRDIGKPAMALNEKMAVAEESLRTIEAETELLSTLFNQIEPFGGRKRGRPRDVPIMTVVRRAIAILQASADDRGVRVQAAGDDVSVRLDEAEVLTVLVNLIQNAIYWTATNAPGHEKKVLVSARRNADSSLTLSVSDSGPGVPIDLRDLIFDPYFSSRPEGVGLGLSIVGNLVEEIYGGELVLVDGGALAGATFEATFRKRV